MAIVKNRLKIFEQNEDPENMTSTKPPMFGQNMSPALQKFMNKQNEVLVKEDQKSTPEEAEFPLKKAPDTPAKGMRNGVGSVTNAKQNENDTPVASANRTVAARPPVGAAKPSDSRRGSKVNVPNIFTQDSVNATTLPESRRGSQVSVPEVFKESSKNPTALSEISSSDENKKPKLLAKPSSSLPRPPPGPKPQSSETSVHGNTHPAILAKKPETNFNQSSAKDPIRGVKLPGLDQLQFKNAHSTAASETASSVSSFLSSQPPLPSEDKVIDVKSLLRPTKVQPATQLADKKVALKPVFPHGTPASSRMAGAEVRQDTADSNKSMDSTLSNNSQNRRDVPGLPSRLQQGNQWPSVQGLKHQNNEPLLERKSDSKKFKKVNLEAGPPSCTTAPEKPALPSNIDLALVKQQYHKTLQTLQDASSDHLNDCDCDATYDDGTSLADVVTRPSTNKRQSDRISIIAEEEGAEYDDGFTTVPLLHSPPPISSPGAALVPETDEMYVDAETERKDEDLDQLYEDEEAFALSTEKLEEEKKRRQKEEAEAKKREEKERKEREKEDEKKRKKEEKDRAKKEKEEMQLRKKFNLTGTETGVGEGTIKQDFKAGVLGGMSFKKGQSVTIVRLYNNPPNKWLIKSDNSMGYIDSSIIEVDPTIIRQIMLCSVLDSDCNKEHSDATLPQRNAMAIHAMENSLSKENSEEQPIYDDVPHDGRSDIVDDGEIYEECP